MDSRWVVIQVVFLIANGVCCSYNVGQKKFGLATFNGFVAFFIAFAMLYGRK